MSEIAKLEEIFNIVKSLSSTLELDAVLKRIGDAAELLTNSEASSIMVVDDDKQHLYFRVATGEKVAVLKKMKVKIGEGIAGNVALTKKSEIINDVSKDARFTGRFDQQSGFKTRNILAVPMVVGENQELVGVVEVLNKKDGKNYTLEDQKILESLSGLAAVSILNAKFNENQRNFFVHITEILVSGIETVRPKFKGRYWKMTQLATLIAKTLGMDPKSDGYRDIYFGTLLHDIGYLSSKLRTAIESATDILKQAEIEREHVNEAYEMLTKINLLKSVALMVKHHHENFDGTGYPDGLKGQNIPLGARIISICEAVENLRYAGNDDQKILKQLELLSGSFFDPELVKIVKEIFESMM
ncbi:MAG: HD domain-containing phosphohydrolase [Endomicrobiia bacterium]